MVPRFAVWSGVLLSLWGCAACERESTPTPLVVVRITPTTAPRLEDAFRALPDLRPQTVDADGSIAAVRALQAKEADLAVVMADIAYHAYIGYPGSETGSEGQIRGIAVLNVNTVYLAAARHNSINSIEDLRGRRVGLGSTGTATTAIATLLLQSSGVGLGRVHGELSGYQDVLRHLSEGKLDAAFLSLNASVQAAAADGARLIPITGAWIEGMRQQHPFLQTVLVPAGTYPGRVNRSRPWAWIWSSRARPIWTRAWFTASLRCTSKGFSDRRRQPISSERRLHRFHCTRAQLAIIASGRCHDDRQARVEAGPVSQPRSRDLCVPGVVSLLGFGYRATKEWQRNSELLVARDMEDSSDMLVTAVVRDMQGAQSLILANRDWSESTVSLADTSTQIASAFARYPYPESFFFWRADNTRITFFHRADRYPAWAPAARGAPRLSRSSSI